MFVVGATFLIVAAGVWYVVTQLPRTETPAPNRATFVASAQTPSAFPPRGRARCGGRCGFERWAVKTLSDPDRERVNLRPVDATIEQLIALEPPALLYDGARAAPVELTVYRVEARLIRLIEEDDHDYHLVLASPTDPSVTMIAEIPDPGCGGACASGFAAVYARVRQELFDRLNATGGERRPLVRVIGVGFFDRIHSQTGVAPNGIELHPVLAAEFVRR